MAIKSIRKRLKAVQSEIRTMNETLAMLANKLKHTNEHLNRHEEKIVAIESQPKMRMQQMITAIISAIAGASVYVNQLYIQSQNKKRSFEIS